MKPGQKPPRQPVRLNGVTLGPDSPLRAGVRQAKTPMTTYTMTEFSVQAGLVELLVGEIGKGDRVPGAGLTGRFPCLLLLYAVPNGASASSAAAAGRRKGEGQLRGMPDLCLPVARSYYHALYLETKRAGGKARARQREVHAMLRAEGNCVLVFDSVQTGLDLVLAYLHLNPGQSLTSVV